MWIKLCSHQQFCFFAILHFSNHDVFQLVLVICVTFSFYLILCTLMYILYVIEVIFMLGGGGDSCRVTAGWGDWQGRDHRLRQRFTICKQQTTRCVNEVSLLKQCDKNERPDEVSLHADKRFVCKKKDGDQLYNNAWMCVNVSSKQIKTTNQFWWWWYRNSYHHRWQNQVRQLTLLKCFFSLNPTRLLARGE